MLYFVSLTQVCNLKCRYCGGEPNPYADSVEVSYPIDILKKFLLCDKSSDICFYGGEPLLRIELLERMMDELPAKRFLIQTNGLFLSKLKTEYLNRFDTILVSIDGRKSTTDYYRGKGVYDRVLENLRNIRQRGFSGDLIARMAISGRSDVYEDVKHLLELENPKFDHVHWQLDVMWDIPPKQRYSDFNRWVNESYNPGISKLIEYWYNKMANDGKVLGIVPFLGIMKSLLFNEKVELRCGSGINAFAITPSGRILACPVAIDFKFAYVGNIRANKPEHLPYKVRIGEPCTSCGYRHICGGRCLFANKTKLWGINGFQEVCMTVKHLIDELIRIKQKIKVLIDQAVIKKEEFLYPPYNNSTEIIP